MSTEVHIHFVRNFTVEPIGRAIVEALSSEGVSARDTYGAYGNVGFELAGFAQGNETPTYLVLSLDLEYFAGGFHSPLWSRDEALGEFGLLLGAIERIPPQVYVIITDFSPVAAPGLPEIPGHRLYGRNLFIRELNGMIHGFAAARANQCAILSFERIFSRLGASACEDQRFSLMSKSPFTQEFALEAAKDFARLHSSRGTQFKKVLVLDCDNTMWGGVVGEVGADGIQLDPYEYPGICYHRFQSQALALLDKGFILCLNSKNDEEAVWNVLENHPHCLIRREHVAAYRINWKDKASNMTSLAGEINLGIDSFVFIDDNPVECEFVRAHLPEVEVLQVPKRIYELPLLLDSVTHFDRASISSEDKLRTGYYLAEKKRKVLQKKQVDPELFLKELQMSASIRVPLAEEIQRVAQLCQRTNQFNLTTRRHDESRIEDFLNSENHLVLLLEASDRFGPMGICGLIILENSGINTVVESFLMSCRIIGRGYDHALFGFAATLALDKWRTEKFQGWFFPTQKNSVVGSLWESYGFREVSSESGRLFECHAHELKISIPNTIYIKS
jgi:FkbH-like protein